MVSHDQKCAVEQFDYLDQRNALVPLTVLLESCDADIGASGIT